MICQIHGRRAVTLASAMLGCCFAVGLSCGGRVHAQGLPRQERNAEAVQPAIRQSQPALEQRVTSRVAAPAEQIRVVLVKDPGLLVELERLVEKEALSKGQLVEDSDLTQDAIFDRLDNDVTFRAAATRLVQRYGYLLPNFNPDSDLGKEEELILKERARRFVQIEEQEDAESIHQQKALEDSTSLASMETCDPRVETKCKDVGPRRSRSDVQAPNHLPKATPDVPQSIRPDTSLSDAPLIQTRALGGMLSGNSARTLGRDDGMYQAMAAGDTGEFPGALAAPQDLQRYLDRGRNTAENSVDDPTWVSYATVSPYDRDNVSYTSTRSKSTRSESLKRDFPQDAIVHTSSPYSDVPSMTDLYVQVSSRQKPPERFGLDLLASGARESDDFVIDLPVGPDYVVGPGDGLAIDLWGGVSQRLQRTVDREGRISLPEYGPLLVSGRTLGNIQETVQQLLRTQLRDISADVSLSRLRTVRVYVAGEVVEPGAYDVSSLSSTLNAIVAAGGLSERGSLRAIKHYRGKQLIEEVDAYDLLLRGKTPNQSRLENGDSLLVPPVGAQVTIEGMVRRPAIYELHGATSLQDALELAGGVLPSAALTHVEVERLVAHEDRTMFSLDLSGKDNAGAAEEKLRNFTIQDGDKIHIFPIAPYNQQTIYLQGHVLRPGRYSYTDGMTVRTLIESYKDLLPEPSGIYAEIIRLNPPDFRPAVESFNLDDAMADPAKAPKLRPLDTVRIFSKYDFEPAPIVAVDGEVRSPGRYTTSGAAHFRDAIYLAGGITSDAATNSAQVIRTEKDGTLKIFSVNLAGALSGNPSDNLALHPRDRIVVHRNVPVVQPAAVYVKGDVVNPGRYPLTSKMRMEDLVHLAGGLRPSADTQSAVLTHHDDTQTGAPEIESSRVDLAAVMTGQPEANKPLANGDVLTIRENPNWNDLGAMVTLRGEVEHPGTYGIRPGESLSSVLAKAGGFTPEAYPYGSVLTRKEVRDLELKSHQELISRVKAEVKELKSLPENDDDQKNAKLTAIAQTDTALTQLETHLPVGRVVIHSAPDPKSFERAAQATPLRNGDVITVPKKPNYVVVQGQVYNTTAAGFIPGRSAKWYLGQAGGVTQLADKKAVFVVRADGSVLAAKNNHTAWSGDPMDAVLMPGDVIVVPEKAPRVGARNWTPLMQSAQVATSLALAVGYLRP